MAEPEDGKSRGNIVLAIVIVILILTVGAFLYYYRTKVRPVGGGPD